MSQVFVRELQGLCTSGQVPKLAVNDFEMIGTEK